MRLEHFESSQGWGSRRIHLRSVFLSAHAVLFGYPSRGQKLLNGGAGNDLSPPNLNNPEWRGKGILTH